MMMMMMMMMLLFLVSIRIKITVTGMVTSNSYLWSGKGVASWWWMP